MFQVFHVSWHTYLQSFLDIVILIFLLLIPTKKANECAKFIIQSGITEIVYVKDNDPDSDSSRASRILFEVSGVKMTQITPSVPSINISFGESACDEQSTTQRQPNGTEMEKYLGLLLREANYNPFTTTSQKKRMNYLSWDDYFMAISFLSAMRPKDPNTQVGVCIVESNKCIIGIGYNGFPRGCSDEILPWARVGDCELHKKYLYVVHAEVNAILNKCSANVKGATIYVALFPCNECSKVIIQSGIKEVVYLKDTYHDTEACRASRIMFRMAGVKLRQYQPECGDILIDFQG